MVCIAIVAVVVVLNERSTQVNADSQARVNEQLQIELQCLRMPAFNADEADAELNINIARGLAAYALGDTATLEELAVDLDGGADDLEAALAARKRSLETCKTND
jgi:hypothetical protein